MNFRLAIAAYLEAPTQAGAMALDVMTVDDVGNPLSLGKFPEAGELDLDLGLRTGERVVYVARTDRAFKLAAPTKFDHEDHSGITLVRDEASR